MTKENDKLFEEIANEYLDKDEKQSLRRDTDCDTILSIPMDNIVFMKHYFKAKGFDTESEDFITEVLKMNEPSKLMTLPEIKYPSNDRIYPLYRKDNMSYTFCSTQN